jgi:hypothetical protein
LCIPFECIPFECLAGDVKILGHCMLHGWAGSHFLLQTNFQDTQLDIICVHHYHVMLGVGP